MDRKLDLYKVSIRHAMKNFHTYSDTGKLLIKYMSPLYLLKILGRLFTG